MATAVDQPRAEEIAKQWPQAVARARELREIFGPEVKLMYARNAQGQELKRRGYKQS